MESSAVHFFSLDPGDLLSWRIQARNAGAGMRDEDSNFFASFFSGSLHPWRFSFVIPPRPARRAYCDHRATARPVEVRAGIGLSPRRYVGVADDAADPVTRLERPRYGCEPLVLCVREGCFAGTFELDADGEVVAAGPAVPARLSGVPRALSARHELDQLAVAADEEVRRHVEIPDRRVVRMRGGVEPVGEKFDDARAAKFSRRQADRVYDEEVHRAARRPRVAVGRGHVARALNESFGSETQLQEGTMGASNSVIREPWP